MARYLSISSGGKAIHIKDGATLTIDSGATMTVTGTLSYTGGVAATTTLTAGTSCAVGTSLTVGTTAAVLGIASFGSAAQTTISAAGVYASSAALSCAVATVTSLVIGAGAGTITDTTATLTLTEDNLNLVGATTVTGALTVTGNTTHTGTTTATGIVYFGGGDTNPATRYDGAGNVSGTTAGTAYTSGAPAFAAAQKSLRVYIGATAYRIPVWADA